MKGRLGIWLFFVLVFCWTWSFWLTAAAMGTSVATTAGQTLLRLGLLGPLIGGIGFACFAHGKDYRRDYGRRIVDSRRVPARWWFAVVLSAPVLIAIAVLLDVASGGGTTLNLVGQRAAAFFATPAAGLAFMVTVLINGPLPEELGWRGYALDQLQARWNALTSSFVLGIIWALWHLPLFIMPGMLHAERGLGSAWFWLFMATVIPMAVIFTWIYNNTRRSTLAAIVFHFMSNLAYDIGNVSDRTNLYATLLWIGAAIAVVVWSGASSLNNAAPDRRPVA